MLSEASSDAGGDSARVRFEEDVEVRFACFEVDAEEGFVVVCLALPFGFGAVEGPALDEGARLGGLKGSLRFFCAGGSPAIAIVMSSSCEDGRDQADRADRVVIRSKRGSRSQNAVSGDSSVEPRFPEIEQFGAIET